MLNDDKMKTTDVEALKCVRVNRGKGGSHDIQQHKHKFSV